MFAGGDRPASLPPDLADPADGAFVACADRGLEHCLAAGRRPDLIVGDFDSVAPGLLERVECRGAERVALPAAKDASDLEVTLERLERGGPAGPFAEACLVGVSGGRTDHLLFNWLLVAARPRPFRLRLVDDTVDAREVRPGAPTRLPGPAGRTVSLLAPRRATGVATRGLRWELAGATIGPGSTLGLSNEIASGDGAEVSVGAGVLLAMLVRGTA